MCFTKKTQRPVDAAAMTQTALTQANMKGFVNTVIFHKPDEKPQLATASGFKGVGTKVHLHHAHALQTHTYHHH